MFIYVDDPLYPDKKIGIRVKSIKVFFTDPNSEGTVVHVWLDEEEEPIETTSTVEEIAEKIIEAGKPGSWLLPVQEHKEER